MTFSPGDEQRRAIEHAGGTLLLLGGPGTGKTTVLEERFVSLVRSGRCTADRILVLVPNRAQKIRLQDRLTERLLFDEGLEALVEVPVYTWHGLANHLVGRHYDRLAYAEAPVLLTSPEQWGDVRDELLKEQEANWPHHRHLLRNRGFVDEVVDFCIRAEQRLLEPHELDSLAAARPAWAALIDFFNRHRERLRSRSRVDYPSLLRDAVELIAQHDDVREALHHRFLHVLVDDGQELALVQQRLLVFLAGGGIGDHDRSVVIAADPDSAIETFRGADPAWLGTIEKDFGAHDTIVLPASYRLGDGAGRRANALIAANGDALHRPTRFKGASTLEVHRFANLAAESEAVARELRRTHLETRIAYEDMAILLTSPRSMLPSFERALEANEVPFSIAAPDRPLGREPIVRAFFDLAAFAFSEDPESERVNELLRSPLVGLDDGWVRELERRARLAGVPLAGLLHDPPDDLAVEAAAGVAELGKLTRLLRSKKDGPADEAFWVIWESSLLCKSLQDRARTNETDPANRDLDALIALSHALGRFVERRRGGTLEDYEHALGRADFGSDPWLPPERRSGGVEVQSFHGAKGREWQVVAVCGVVEGAIPKGRRAGGLFDPYLLDEADPVERIRRNEAEDRRVFYVAATRASSRCIVTTSPGPTRRGFPSRFIQELAGEPPEVRGPAEMRPLTFSEAATRHRKMLSTIQSHTVETSIGPAERVAALAALARIGELDPECRSARPSEWWWRWDWTEGRVPIRRQQADSDELPLHKLRTSYSRISQYDNCGLQYLCSVVLGLDPTSSHNMAFGTWIHKVFEEIERDRITHEQALARYEELFDPGVFPNRAVARQFRHDGELMIGRYFRFLKPYKANKFEVVFRADIDGHLVKGRIDRVDVIGKNVVVTDYKTSRHAVEWDEARNSLQLAIYHFAAKNDPNIAALGEPASQQLVYPAIVSKDGVVKRCQKPEEAEAAILRLPELIEGVLAEDFRPNPEADCKWCKFKPLCPLWSEGRELPA